MSQVKRNFEIYDYALVNLDIKSNQTASNDSLFKLKLINVQIISGHLLIQKK